MNFLPFTHNNLYIIINLSPDLFINLSIALIIILYSYYSKIINRIELLLSLFSYLLPLKYLGDQIPYTNFTREIRMGLIPQTGSITLISSYIYSLLPFATPSSVVSLSMYNKIIFLLLLIFLKKKSYIGTDSSIILLLFPSLLLYSSLALREMLVLAVMIIWLISILNRKYILSILCVLTFVFLKRQNIYLFGFFTIFHIYYYYFLINYKKNKLLFFTSSAVFILSFFYFQDKILLQINYYIQTMYVDDVLYGGINYIDPNIIGRNVNELKNTNSINNIFQLMQGIFLGSFNAIFGNLNFFSSNSFVLFQSIENILIFILLLVTLFLNFNKNLINTIFWFIFIFVSLGILGLVIQNFGTLSRFKYSFIVLFIIAMNFKNKNLFIKSI